MRRAPRKNLKGTIEASREIVASYPRERFGSMAMDTELIVYIDAKLRYLHTYAGDMSGIQADHIYSDLYSIWRTGLTIARVPAQDHWDYHDRAAAQVYVLWARTPSDPLSRIKGIGSGALGLVVDDGVGTKYATEWFNRYWALYDHPEYLPFYEAGVFDNAAIEAAISADIDASMLVSVTV